MYESSAMFCKVRIGISDQIGHITDVVRHVDADASEFVPLQSLEIARYRARAIR